MTDTILSHHKRLHQIGSDGKQMNAVSRILLCAVFSQLWLTVGWTGHEKAQWQLCYIFSFPYELMGKINCFIWNKDRLTVGPADY